MVLNFIKLHGALPSLQRKLKKTKKVEEKLHNYKSKNKIQLIKPIKQMKTIKNKIIKRKIEQIGRRGQDYQSECFQCSIIFGLTENANVINVIYETTEMERRQRFSDRIKIRKYTHRKTYFVLGPHPAMLRGCSWLSAYKLFLEGTIWAVGDQTRVGPCARQKPDLLFYHSAPPHKNLYINVYIIAVILNPPPN